MIYFLTLKRFSCLMIKLGSCAMLGRNNDLPLSSLNILVGKMALAASHLLFFICDKQNRWISLNCHLLPEPQLQFASWKCLLHSRSIQSDCKSECHYRTQSRNVKLERYIRTRTVFTKNRIFDFPACLCRDFCVVWYSDNII